jgi:hypothetical protein
MNDSILIYRSSDRPKYVLKTFRHLLENTGPDLPVLFFDNSSPEMRPFVKEAAQSAQSMHIPISDDRDIQFYFHNKPRIGGTQAIIEGVKLARAQNPNLKKVYITDDDVLLPMAHHAGGNMAFWNDVLNEMLEAGWGIVAHPWSHDFRSKETQQIGGIKGYPYSGVGGGCSAFRMDIFDKYPLRQDTLIRGYNEWMTRAGRNVCGYSYNYQMCITHMDRPEHPWSLRDTEYDEWATAMYYERFPKKKGQPRPKGSAGVW